MNDSTLELVEIFNADRIERLESINDIELSLKQLNEMIDALDRLVS